MIDRLILALVRTKNEAADDLLVQALRLGVETEKHAILDALLRRKTSRGLGGVIALYDDLPESAQLTVLENIGTFHHALAECGRSDDVQLRLAAMRLIALGRQGKLAYVLSENLHEADEVLSKAASEAMVALARWVATETRKLQRGTPRNDDAQTRTSTSNVESTHNDAEKDSDPHAGPDQTGDSEHHEESSAYRNLIEQRPEIEAAVARAINLHRGKHGQELLRAALLLADWAGSKTLAILQTAKHGGQSPMVRRLQQPPESEHVEAFLLGASHGRLRSHFGVVFSHVDQAPVLDALLRKTHWLADHQLQVCVQQVNRGIWWGMGDLARDVERRTPSDAARIADWLALSGIHDVEQDERMQLLLERANREADAPGSLSARLRLLNVAMRRKRGASVRLIKAMLNDKDERIVRMAAREVVRRRPADYENLLLKMMTTATPGVRRVIGRAIGQAGFEQYWQRFDKLDKATRQAAGRAMLKLLPDAAQRLQRRAAGGSPEQRVKAMQIAQELGLAEMLQPTIVLLCSDSNSRVRSKAVAVAGEVPSIPSEVLVERVVHDADPRVRANAIEVLETRGDPQFMPVLAERALAGGSRERANAIKAMHRMKVSTASTQLLAMLRDQRPEHRISALWALRQIGWWQLINEVGRLARDDSNIRVKRYALGVLKNVAEVLKERKKAAG